MGRGERDAAADVVGVDGGGGGDGEGEAREVAEERGGRVPAGGAEEEALDAGEGGVGGGGGGRVGADEARVVEEGDGGGGLALGLGVEEHVDAPLPRGRRHQRVVADVEPDHAHRRRAPPIRGPIGGNGGGAVGFGARCDGRWRWKEERCAGGYGPVRARRGGGGPGRGYSPVADRWGRCLLPVGTWCRKSFRSLSFLSY